MPKTPAVVQPAARERDFVTLTEAFLRIRLAIRRILCGLNRGFGL
jgi:hypothetical protein